MNIIIKTIPHKHQRYETVGDYFKIGELDTILVSNMGNPDYEFLVAVHELVEMYLCQRRGISERSICSFDIKFEKNRKEGNLDEPGDDPKAPYQNEHNFATAVERMVCAALGVKWKEYEKAVNKLSQ
jgi:hypothetical protein